MKNGIKTISYTTNFGKQIDIYFKFHKYLDNGNTAVQIFHRDKESGDEPWSFLTVNLDLKLPETHAFIDINNNGGTIVDWLVENGFAENTYCYRRSGFCSYPLVHLNLDKLKEYGYAEEDSKK